MKFDQFMNQVKARAHLASDGEAVRSTRATLETLGERLIGGAAHNLASQLPEEVGLYLERAHNEGKFGLQEFYHRVGQKERADYPKAVHHAKAVMTVVTQSVSSGEMAHVRAQLGPEFDDLFEQQEAA